MVNLAIWKCADAFSFSQPCYSHVFLVDLALRSLCGGFNGPHGLKHSHEALDDSAALKEREVVKLLQKPAAEWFIELVSK